MVHLCEPMPSFKHENRMPLLGPHVAAKCDKKLRGRAAGEWSSAMSWTFCVTNPASNPPDHTGAGLAATAPAAQPMSW